MVNDFFTYKGKLIFDPKNITKKHEKQSEWKKTAFIEVNDDTCEYYRWFIEKRFNLRINKPLRKPHVTIINDKYNNEYEWSKLKEKWEGKELHFFFSWESFRTNVEHYFFKVECPCGQKVRDEIGLGSPYYDFHLTIGYVPTDQVVRYEHSKYILRQIKKFKL